MSLYLLSLYFVVNTSPELKTRLFIPAETTINWSGGSKTFGKYQEQSQKARIVVSRIMGIVELGL